MRIRYGKYGVEADWDYGSTSTATQTSNTEVFQIQFNLYMPSSQYDPKLVDSPDQFYTCHSQVLTLPRDQIPRICFCVRCTVVELVKFINHWVELYKSHDPYWNMSEYEKLESTFMMRIIKFLKSMPLVGHGVDHTKFLYDIYFEILHRLGRTPKGWSCRIPEGFFINVDIYLFNQKKVDIYHESVPYTPSAAELDDLLLKEVRLDRLCSICREDFDKDVIATRLPCSHIFHDHCVLRCLEKDDKCPLCREPIPHYQNSALTLCDSITGCKHSYYVEVERKVCAPNSCSRRPSLSCRTFLCVYLKEFDPAKKRICIHEGSDDLHIQFNLYKTNGVGCVGHYGEVERYDGVGKIQPGSEPQLLTIPNRHREQLGPTMITQVLKSMGVPLYEEPPIVAKIFEVIANNNFDDPYAFINVDLYEETLSLVDLFPVNKAPNKVAIEELGRVKIDKSCAICKDDFSDGTVLASGFACFHIFHIDCILSWLETDHKCPLCRYPLAKS